MRRAFLRPQDSGAQIDPGFAHFYRTKPSARLSLPAAPPVSAPQLPTPPISQFPEAPDMLESRVLPLQESPPAPACWVQGGQCARPASAPAMAAQQQQQQHALVVHQQQLQQQRAVIMQAQPQQLPQQQTPPPAEQYLAPAGKHMSASQADLLIRRRRQQQHLQQMLRTSHQSISSGLLPAGPQQYMSSGFGAGGIPRGLLLPERFSLLRSETVPQGFSSSRPMGPLTQGATAVTVPVPTQSTMPATPPQSMMHTALPPAETQLQSMMRAALGPMAFKTIRSLMLRQQSTYKEQLSELHVLSQVQRLLVCEMQIQTPAGGNGAFTPQAQQQQPSPPPLPPPPPPPPPQQQQQPPRRSLFSPNAMPGREYGCISPQLRRIVRYLGHPPNAPKAAVHGGGGIDKDISACPPPLPPSRPSCTSSSSGSPLPTVARGVQLPGVISPPPQPPCAVELPPQLSGAIGPPPRDDVVSGGSGDSRKRSASLQGGLKRTASQLGRKEGRVFEAGGVEGEDEEGRGDDGAPQQQRRLGDKSGDDVGSSRGAASDLLPVSSQYKPNGPPCMPAASIHRSSDSHAPLSNASTSAIFTHAVPSAKACNASRSGTMFRRAAVSGHHCQRAAGHRCRRLHVSLAFSAS